MISATKLWTPDSRQFANKMYIDSHETHENLNNYNDFVCKTEPNSSSDEIELLNGANGNWSENYVNHFEAIDLLTSPKFHPPITKVNATEGPLDLECLYYDQFQYTSSPEQISPKRELCDATIESYKFQIESQSPKSSTFSNLLNGFGPQSLDLTLESVINDAISLESSFNGNYTLPNSSSDLQQMPIICHWIDCYLAFNSQEELVSK